MTDLSTILADVVRESADGVRAAELEMDESVREIERTLARPAEDLVDESDIDDYLIEHFPDPRRDDRTFVRPGVPYLPGLTGAVSDPTAFDVDLAEYAVGPAPRAIDLPVRGSELPTRNPEAVAVEFPAVIADRLSAADAAVPVLTARHVGRVRRVVAHELGCDRRAALRAVLERGVPRAVTETLDTTVKVSFNEDLDLSVPNYDEVDVGVVPEALGSVSTHIRFERGP